MPLRKQVRAVSNPIYTILDGEKSGVCSGYILFFLIFVQNIDCGCLLDPLELVPLSCDICI